MEYVIVVVAVWVGQWVIARGIRQAPAVPLPCQCDCKASTLPMPLCAPVDFSGVYKRLDGVTAAVAALAVPVVEPPPPILLTPILEELDDLRAAVREALKQKAAAEAKVVAVEAIPSIRRVSSPGAALAQARIKARQERRNG